MNRIHSPQLRATARAASLALAMLALAAAASAATDPGDDGNAKDDADAVKLNRVEVTGSSIKRISRETASPLQVISRQQIQDEGANTLQEVLQNLPQSAPALVDSQSMFTGTDGASQANLRGLGPQATLVLLNGRRLSSYGAPSGFQYQFVNVDTIPADAIERIEVLTDGASAIYGSDAIAGVINVITKKSYKGLEVRGSTQQSLRTRTNGEHQAAVSFGTGDLDTQHFNIFGTLSYYKRDAVYLPDVINDFPAQFYQVNPNFYKNYNIYDGSQPGTINPGTLFVYDANGARHGMAAPGCPSTRYSATNSSCPLDTLPLGQFTVPSSERSNLFVSAHYQFNDDWEGFTELSATHIDMYSATQPSNYSSGYQTTWYARNTGFGLNSFTMPYLSATNPYNKLTPTLAGMMNGIAGLQYTFLDDNSIFHNENTDDEYRLMSGVRGTIKDWDVETALSLAGTHSVLYQDTNVSLSGFAKAFGPFTTDPTTGLTLISDHPAYQFGTTNASNAALLAQIFPNNAYPSWDKLATWDGKASGKIGTLPGGDLQLAAGFNIAYEKFYSPGNPAAANGDIVWQGGSWFSGHRTTEAAYTELLAPLTRTLEANAALRVDKYPTFAAHVVPKFGLKFEATPELALRATYSQGFRAPSLAESGTGGVYAQTVVNDPVRCNQTNAIAALLQKSTVGSDVTLGQQLQNADCQTVAGGITSPNAGLKPETAQVLTTGFVFQPNKTWDLSADYFFIYRKNEIVSVSSNQVLAEQIAQYGPALKGSSVASRLPVSAADRANLAALAQMCANPANAGICPATLPGYSVGDVAGIITGYMNRTRTLVDGFDVDANAHLGLGGWGRLDLGAQATLKHRYRTQDVNGSWQADMVGLYGTPQVTATLRADWHVQNYVVSLLANYVGGQSLWGGSTDSTWDYPDCVANAALTPSICARGVPANTYLNANFVWDVTKNLKLDINMQNILNKQPTYDPVADSWYGTHGVNQLQNYQGRIVNISGSYKFW